MNIKNLSFHLLLSASLSLSAFASDNEEKSGSGMKPTAQTAFGDTSSSSAAKKPRHEESIVALNEKPSIHGFPIRGSKEYTLRGPALFSVEDKLGKFYVLPQEIIIEILKYVNPYQTMGIGSTFYTFATGYKKERMGLIGLGPDKEPDYADSIFSIREEGIRVHYDDDDGEYDNNAKYPIHAHQQYPALTGMFT